MVVYKILEVKNDFGWIFTEFISFYSIQKSSLYTSQPDIYKYDNNSTAIYFLEISFDKVGKKYDRIYRKIQNIFADLGGLFNSFILIGNILIYHFNKKKFDYDIVNFLFKYEDVNENYKNKLISPVLNNYEGSNCIFEKNNFHNCNTITKKKEETIELKNNSFRSHKILQKNKTSIILISENNYFIQNQFKKSNLSFNNFEKKNSNINNIINHENFMKDENLNLELNEEKLKKNIENFVNHNFKKKQKKFFKFTKAEFIKTFLCCQSFKSGSLKKKEKFFNFTSEKVFSYLDVLNYTRLYEDFEKLKMIIFNKYQNISFNFLKPRNYFEINSENYKEDILETVKYLKNQENEASLNSYDEKFKNLLNDEFKKLLEN